MIAMDPKISFVPKWMMDWGMKMMINDIIDKIFEIARNFKGSKWEKKLKGGPYKEFYDWTEAVFKDYVEKNKSKLLK